MNDWEGIWTGDQVGATFPSEVVPSPPEQDPEFVVEFDQVGDVNEYPRELAREAAESQPAQAGHRCIAPDNGKVDLVDIFERWQSCSLLPGQDELGCVATHLHRHRGHTGERTLDLMSEAGQVTDDDNFGVILNGQVRIDNHLSSGTQFHSGFSGKQVTQGRGLHSAAQSTVCVGIR